MSIRSADLSRGPRARSRRESQGAREPFDASNRARVVVGVVEEDDIAGAQFSARRPSHDLLRGCPSAPILAPARPEQRRKAGFAGCAQACPGVNAQGRPVQDRGCPGGVLDRATRASQVVSHCTSAQAQLDSMSIAVERGGVSTRDDCGRDVRMPVDLLAHEEEVAFLLAASRTSRTAGLPSGCGPSSKVSATPGASIRSGMPAEAARPGTSGASVRSTSECWREGGGAGAALSIAASGIRK